MANTADIELDDIVVSRKNRGGKGGLIIGLLLMLLLGGGGFFATFSGMFALPFGGDAAHVDASPPKPWMDLPPTAFVPLDEIVISLGRGARAKHLVLAAELEIDPAMTAEVELLRPRVLDVLNTYLRALDERDIEDPAAMTRLRAQMLRRIQVVTGEGRVRDLLITRFVMQ